MSYLEKLKKNMNETIVDPAETTEEKVSSLKERFADLLALYLRTLGETLKNIDTEIQKAIAEAKHLSVGSIFDKEFEKSVRREIDNWLLFDEVFRVRVEKVVRAYGIYLTDDQINLAFQSVEDEKQELSKHVKAANNYGADWTKRMDDAGLSISDPLLRNHIKWFTNLSLAELKADFRRAIKKNLKDMPRKPKK